MTGLKDQCFGVEVEMTGITRKQAAQALADYFGTIPKAKGGVYDTWKVKDPTGKSGSWSATPALLGSSGPEQSIWKMTSKIFVWSWSLPN